MAGISTLLEPSGLAESVGAGILEVGLSAGLALAINRAFEVGPDESWSLLAGEEGVPEDALLKASGPPVRFAMDKGVNVVVNEGFMDFEPSSAPTSSAPMAFDLEHLFPSSDNSDDLTPVVRAMQAMTERAPTRTRPPIMRLVYGPWDIPVWVTNSSVELGPMWQGSQRPVWVRVRATLVQARMATAETADPTRPRETTWKRMGDGDTFELMAARLYRRPEMGVLLRRINPEILEEEPGKLVKMLDLDHPRMREAIVAKSPALVEDMESQVQRIAEERMNWTSGSWASLGLDRYVTESAVKLYEV